MAVGSLPAGGLAALPPQAATRVSSSYGDREIASTHCELPDVPEYVAGEWQHGWIWEQYNCHPEMIVGSDGLSRQRRRGRFFVARADHVRALESFGYPDVHAIGLPIVYLRRPAVERVKGSLLVLPSHSLPERNEGWTGEEYARYLSRIVGSFSRVGLCLSSACIAKGLWQALRPLARDLYVGASVQDRNSLARLAVLFSSYEYVTTNDFGSHVPYAAYFGAKVSVAGPKVAWDRVDATPSPLYRNCPECAQIMKRVKTQELFASHAQFCVDPRAAVENADWARWQLGEQHKRAPHELRRLFGWDARGRALHVARGTVSPRRWLRYLRSARPLVATLGLPGLVAAFQLGRAARKITGLSPVWCGWTKRLALRNGSTDLDVFQQHFARRDMLAIRFEKEASTIVDLGASVGVSVQALRRRFPRARIVALERDRESAALCRANHASDPRISVLTGALWSGPGPVRAIDVGDGARALRAVPAAADDPRSVPAFNYRQILEMHRLRTIDVLRMDIEGAEADVLESAWEDIFGTAAVAIIEVHDRNDGIEERVRATLERARQRFDLDISRSGELRVVRNRALGAA